MKIVFFGSGYYTIPVIEKLRGSGLVLVVTIEVEGKLIDYLRKEDIPYLYSHLNNEKDIKKVQDLKPDVGVLASYGAFIPKKIIGLFPLGILNIHPSLLPKYKGPSPIQYAILDGEKNTGVSIIKLDDKIDHGPIISQKPFKIGEKDTLKNATELMFSEGADMIYEIIQKMLKGLLIKETPQRIKGESWTEKIDKARGEIFIDNPPQVSDLDRMIRAFYPWPGVYLTASLGKNKRILKLLPNNMYQVEGKLPMSYKDFLNGHGNDAAYILAKLGR